MSGLNPAQAAAVEHTDGPMLVLAGAGSGKTRVITHRIARLVDRGVRPSSILAVSFTNKAAAEMRERMIPLVGHEDAHRLWLSTFHSFGVRFLQEETRALGYEGRFVIFDQGDCVGLLRELMREEGIPTDRSFDMMAIVSRISLWKNAFQMPGNVREIDYEYDNIARAIYPLYLERLESMHAVDFDDLVVRPVQIMREREDLRKKWRARFRHVMIDEFQDTNIAQLALVKQIVDEHQNICVVGDDDQSIYGWRGADVGNILDFEKTFRGAKVVKLEMNYRSRAPILEVANAVIAQSKTKRHEKQLRPARGSGPKVRVVNTPDTTAEIKFVAREIHDLRKGGDASPGGVPRKYKDIAILYRSNTQAKLFEEELRVAGIPYRMFGGTQLFDRKEVKDIIAYLRVVNDPEDELSLRRILNTPARGFGSKALKTVRAYGLRHGLSFYQSLRRLQTLDVPVRTARNGMDLLSALQTARDALETGAPLEEVTQRLLEETGFTSMIFEDQTKVGERRRENIEFLMRTFRRFDSERKISLAQLLARISLREETGEEDDSRDEITLSSLHSSKGLEFNIVFLIGCVEGKLPHQRTVDPKLTDAAPTGVDEERRLFYVGVTRARDLLYLTRASGKKSRGRTAPLFPSRFLEGLPDESVEMYTASAEKEMSPDEVANFADMILAKLRK